MEERQYLTDEDYAVAEANGIPAKNAYFRVNVQGWGVERAIFTPLRELGKYGWELWESTAEANGVTYSAYYKRVRFYHWEQERAATTPPRKKKRKERNA